MAMCHLSGAQEDEQGERVFHRRCTYIYIYSTRPIRAQGGPARARPTRAQGGPQGPGPQGPRGAHKGPAHKGPGGPQGPGPQGPRGAHACRCPCILWNTRGGLCSPWAPSKWHMAIYIYIYIHIPRASGDAIFAARDLEKPGT